MSWNFTQVTLPIAADTPIVDVTSNSDGTQLLAITLDFVYVYTQGINSSEWYIVLLPAGSGNFDNIAIDSDPTGNYLICGSGGTVNVSTPNTNPSNSEQRIKFVVAIEFGLDHPVVDVSIGQTYTDDTGSIQVYMYAAVINSYGSRDCNIYVSNNSGLNWVKNLTIPNSPEFSSISAAQGSGYVYVVSSSGLFYISTSNGEIGSWIYTGPLNVPGIISINETGQYSIFGMRNFISQGERTQTITSVSTTTGSSYTPISSLTFGETPPVAVVDSTGQFMFTAASASATSTVSNIYYSSNSGQSFVSISNSLPNITWTVVATNTGGTSIICGTEFGGLYIGTLTSE